MPRIVDQLSDEFEFLLVTRDRDLGDSTPLAGVVPDRWVARGRANCLYLSTRRRMIGRLIATLRRTRHEALYLNSIFSVEFSLVPLLVRRFGIIPRQGLIIAPRGELDESALSIKHQRKRLYLRLSRWLGLQDKAVWHAANRGEADAVARQFGNGAQVLIAADIPVLGGATDSAPTKRVGQLEVVFLSRISRMKNLDFAIDALMTVRGRVNVHVFGPIEDAHYWEECQHLAARLPANVTFQYGGIVEPDKSLAVLAGHHLLFLPSRAESFGHVIVESFIAGRPVLISDQTPWRDLAARRAGWEFPLSQRHHFSSVITRCAEMSQEEFQIWSAGARRLGRDIATDPARESAYRSIFRAALNPTKAGARTTGG